MIPPAGIVEVIRVAGNRAIYRGDYAPAGRVGKARVFMQVTTRAGSRPKAELADAVGLEKLTPPMSPPPGTRAFLEVVASPR